MLQVVSMFKESDQSYQQASGKVKSLFDLNMNMIEHEEAGDMDSLPASESLNDAEDLEEDYMDIQPIPE